jgi:hypothetical protein
VVKDAIWILAAVCAPVLFDAADAMDVERANAQYKDREYRIELDLVLHEPAARIEAVLRDYASYPSLDAGILESKVLSRPDATTVMLYTKLRACSGLFCRTVQRVERVQESPFELLAVAVPEQSDVVSGQSHTVLQTVAGGTRVSYRLTILPKFWVPPFIGRAVMLRTLREVSLNLFRQVEVRAQHDRS